MTELLTDRPRVLVLDPTPQGRELAEAALGRHCDLICQPDPYHIFNLLEIFQPDLLITELALPGLPGFELISLIRHYNEFRELRVLLFSDQSETETQKMAYRLGALHFQAKPCKPSQLLKAAGAFFRLAGGQLPERRHSMDEVHRLLDERQSDELDPRLRDAFAHSALHHRTIAPHARRLVAQVSGARMM